jgi:hypothetical protein
MTGSPYGKPIYYIVLLVILGVLIVPPVLMSYLTVRAKRKKVQSLERRLEEMARKVLPKVPPTDLSLHSPGPLGHPETPKPERSRTRWDLIG